MHERGEQFHTFINRLEEIEILILIITEYLMQPELDIFVTSDI